MNYRSSNQLLSSPFSPPSWGPSWVTFSLQLLLYVNKPAKLWVALSWACFRFPAHQPLFIPAFLASSLITSLKFRNLSPPSKSPQQDHRRPSFSKNLLFIERSEQHSRPLSLFMPLKALYGLLSSLPASLFCWVQH